MPHRLRALIGATLLCAFYAVPVPAETCATTETAQPAKPKKKGFGLGGLLKAAKNAGAGELLGAGDVLGTGKTARVAGAVASTAVAASDGGPGANVAGTVIGLAGQGRTAQVAGTVTGTAAELARTGSPLAAEGARAKPCRPAKAATAPAASTWN